MAPQRPRSRDDHPEGAGRRLRPRRRPRPSSGASIPRCDVERLAPEGEWREPPAAVLRAEGDARALLTGERTALNFLQRLSGVAT